MLHASVLSSYLTGVLAKSENVKITNAIVKVTKYTDLS